MTSTVAVAFAHPTATEQQVDDLLWSKAQVVAARSGRAPVWPPTAHDARDTDDGFVEHRPHASRVRKTIRDWRTLRKAIEALAGEAFGA